jgi:hypothetical protein
LIWCVRKSGRDLADRVGSWLAWQRVHRDLIEGVLGQDIEHEERQEVQAKAKEALNAAKDAVWADFRFVVFADNGEPDRLRSIDLGAGHSSSNDTLSGRVLAALKSHGLLNETVGAGYIERNWPPALTATGAWPLSGLRQSFLDGSLTRLLDPEQVVRSKIIEFVEAGEFGMASGSLPNGQYQRPNRFLLRKDVGASLKAPASAPTEPRVDPEPRVVSPPPESGEDGQPQSKPEQKPRVLRVSGEVPSEQWNRIGTKLIPKLRSAGNLRVDINASATVESPKAAAFVEEVEQIIQDLGLQGKLHIVSE